ncbi:ATP-dependent DNA helicase [Trichonephila clavipes]|nr:ATP-dependent DNA helicase [Trichonephila clavipes]
MLLIDTNGLPYQTVNVKNIYYMIITNIGGTEGLANGAVGKLVHVETNYEGLVKTIWLEFPDLPQIGKKLRRKAAGYAAEINVSRMAVPIVLRSSNIPLNNNKAIFVKRTHVPLVCACTTIIHKSQVLSETLLDNESDISIPNFNCIVKNKRSNTRVGGVAIYQNSSDAVKIITPSMDCSVNQSDIYGTIQSSVEELCLAECVIHNAIIEFLHRSLLAYTSRGSALLNKNDEAHFWLNGYVNKQNCRIWSEANPQVYVETPSHPETLTVWCALWAGGILLQKR